MPNDARPDPLPSPARASKIKEFFMNRMFTLLVAAASVVALNAMVFGQDRTTEEQYTSAAQAKAKAELAVRQARDFFAKNEPVTRNAIASADKARVRAVEIYRKFVEAEQRKPEDQRNLNAIDEASQNASQLQVEWDDKATREMAPIDVLYREASQYSALASQLFQNLTTTENTWKDAKLDLTPLQATYDVLAKATSDRTAQAQKAINDALTIQKAWEARVETATKATAAVKK